jgi:4-hydroxybenzoate polyprenyltransferase
MTHRRTIVCLGWTTVLALLVVVLGLRHGRLVVAWWGLVGAFTAAVVLVLLLHHEEVSSHDE